MTEEANVEYVDDLTNNAETDDFLNGILEQSLDDIPVQDEEEEEQKEETPEQEEPKEEPVDDEKLRKETNRKNAERRLKEKEERQKKEQSDSEPVKRQSIDEIEITHLRQQSEWLQQQYNAAKPVMDFVVQNNLTPDKLKLGADFVRNWETDKIATVKMLLTDLHNSGINVGQILDHDDQRMQVMNEVDRRMMPVRQQQMQMQEAERTRQEADNFLNTYPDAIEHVEEIVDVMRRTGKNNPLTAYLALRRSYEQNGKPWFREDVENEQLAEIEQLNSSPAIATRNVAPVYTQVQPLSTKDFIRSETRKLFGRK